MNWKFLTIVFLPFFWNVFFSLLIYIENKNKNNGQVWVFQPSAVPKAPLAVVTASNLQDLWIFWCSLPQLCRVGWGSLTDIFRSPWRFLNGFKAGSRLSQPEVLRTPDQFFIKYISALCSVQLSLDPDQSAGKHQPDAATIRLRWWLTFGLWELSSICTQDLCSSLLGSRSPLLSEKPFPQISRFSQTVGSEESPGCPKLLSFQNDGGCGHLGDRRRSGNVFVASPDLSAWTQSCLWALRESLNLRVWILGSTISRKCVVWLFKHSFSFIKLSHLTSDHVSQHPLKNT